MNADTLDSIRNEITAAAQGDSIPLAEIKKAVEKSGFTLTSEDLDALLFAASVDSVGDAVNTEHFLKNCISLLPQYATHEGAPQAGSPANAGESSLSQMSKLREIFEVCDHDNDGKIYKADLHELVERMNPDQTGSVDATAVDVLMNRLDPDGKGYITFDDFLRGSFASLGSPSASRTPSKSISINPSRDEHVDNVFALSYTNSPSGPIANGSSVEDNEDSDVEALKQRNRALGFKVQSMESKLSQSESSHMELMERMKKHQDAHALAQKQAQQLKSLEDEKQRLIDEIENQKLNAQTLRETLKEAGRREFELTAAKNKLESELQEKESLLASTETELIKVKQAMGKESDDAKTKKKDAAELQDKYDTLAREKQELELKLASIQKLNTLLQSQQVETQEALEEAKARIVALEEDTLLKNPPLKRSSSSKNLRSELEGSLKAEIVPADVGRLQELEKAKLDLEVKCAVLESEKADLATQVDQLENYKKSAHQLSQTLESEKAELDKKLAELQAQLASASTNGAVVDEDALAALKTQLAALEAERSQLQAQINQLEQEKVDLASKLQVVGSEQSSHASRSQQLELEKAKLTSQLQQGLQEKEQLAAQLKRAEADNIQLASELEEARQQLHNNKELLEMSSSSSDLQQKTSVARLAALEQEKATLTASLREMEQQRSFIEAAKAQLTSRITQLEAELEKAESSRTIEAELRTEIAGLQKEKASLVERSQQLESQFAFAQQTITTLTDEKTRLADLNRQFETEGNDLQNRLQILQADLAAAKKKIVGSVSSEAEQEAIQELRIVKERNDELRDEVKKLQDQLTLASLRTPPRAPGSARGGRRGERADDSVIQLEEGDESASLVHSGGKSRQDDGCACCTIV